VRGARSTPFFVLMSLHRCASAAQPKPTRYLDLAVLTEPSLQHRSRRIMVVRSHYVIAIATRTHFLNEVIAFLFTCIQYSTVLVKDLQVHVRQERKDAVCGGEGG
jgi:hypothetical protein